jgi:hypothetical protein
VKAGFERAKATGTRTGNPFGRPVLSSRKTEIARTALANGASVQRCCETGGDQQKRSRQAGDTRNPTSKLMLTILGGVATWEREIILERQREGIAEAKAEGKYKGRKPTVAVQAEQIRAMRAAGEKPMHGNMSSRSTTMRPSFRAASWRRLGCMAET